MRFPKLFATSLIFGGSLALSESSQFYIDGLFRFITNRSNFDISYDSIEGRLFWNRPLEIRNLRLSDPQTGSTVSVKRVLATTSIWGFLFGPSNLFKSLDVTGVEAAIPSAPPSTGTRRYARRLARLRSLRVADMRVKLGVDDGDITLDGPDASSTNLYIKFFDVGPYGLTAKRWLTHITLDATIDGDPVILSSRTQTARPADSFADLSPVRGISEMVKYSIRHELGDSILPEERYISARIDAKTVQKLAKFADIRMQSSTRSPCGKLEFVSRLVTDANFNCNMIVRWKNTVLPQLELDTSSQSHSDSGQPSDSGQAMSESGDFPSKMAAFLWRMVDSRPSWSLRVHVDNERSSLKVLSDKPNECRAILRFLEAACLEDM
eukprot:87873_1